MMSARIVIALAVSVTAVDVATIHRNRKMESIRSAASPNAPLRPSRLRVLPGGRLEGTGISVMELVREAHGYTNRRRWTSPGRAGWMWTS
jgi:hypothetical protein